MLSYPIEIDDQYYYEILSELGYPFVQETDLEFSREEIETYFILPAMREYFRWYPLQDQKSYSVSGVFSIDFPDLFTFGITDARVNSQVSGSGATGNPLINEIVYSHSNVGRYGTRYDYDLTQAKIIERMETQSFSNYSKAVNIKVDRKNRVVSGYSTMSGELMITWAKWDSEFGAIPFNHIDEVEKLAKAKVLRGFGMLRGQQASNTEIEFNYQDFLDRAKDLEEEVIPKWKAHTKVVVMRG